MFYFSEDYAIIKYRTELTNNLIDALCSGTKASKEDHRDLAIGFVLTLLRNPITFWKLNLIDELAERIGYFPPNKDGLIYYDRINDRFYIYDKESNKIYHNTSINNKILQELLDYIEKVFGQKPIPRLVNNDFNNEDYSNLKYLLHSSFNYPPYKLKIETININKRNSMKKIGELEFIIYKFSDKDYNR